MSIHGKTKSKSDYFFADTGAKNSFFGGINYLLSKFFLEVICKPGFDHDATNLLNSAVLLLCQRYIAVKL